jgi:hypothetical protein
MARANAPQSGLYVMLSLALLFAAATANSAEPPVGTARNSSARAKRVPDLQGIWTGAVLTPLERPQQFADRPRFKPEEMAEEQRQATERFWAAGHRPGDVGRDNDAFLDGSMKILPDGRTSLISEPANGLLPLRAEAERRRDYNVSHFDSYEIMSQWDRCITRQPLMMLPSAYNSAYQIVQTATHVVIVAEMIHDARIIALHTAAPADSRIKSWGGTAHGRWEGETLVVETRNFSGKGWLATAQSSGRLRGVPISEQLRTIERFQLVDANTMQYELTIEDPQSFTSPWKITLPLTRDTGYQIFEYACHEGNSAVRAMMLGAQSQEQAGR